MSMATTRRLAKLEQAAAGPRTRPVLKVGRLAADHPGALIIVTGVLRAARGLQA
jgi:hypothetical protein